MKRIDFTKPGGFPLTQDNLNYLQSAYTELFGAIAQLEGADPVVVSGCKVTRVLSAGTVYDYTVTNGWVYYNGEFIRVVAAAVIGLDESTDALYFLITPTAAPLTYNDGSTPNVVLDNSATIASFAIGTVEDATHFKWSSLISDAWRSVVPNPATVWRDGSNPIICRRQPGRKTVMVTGTSETLGHFSGINGASRKMATLPAGYRPARSIIKIVATTDLTPGTAYIELLPNGDVLARGDLAPHDERWIQMEFSFDID